MRECIRSWEPLRGLGFERIVFDDASARWFIERQFGPQYAAAFDVCYHPAMRCDYFRLCYILAMGGFYVDADEVFLGPFDESWFHGNRLKVQPLCYDRSTDAMVRSELLQDQARTRRIGFSMSTTIP